VIASLSAIGWMDVRARIALLLALAFGGAIVAGAHAQEATPPVQPVAVTVEQITAEANARTAAGMPAADVEAWIGQAMTQAGLSVREPPERWDVYGQARWDRESAAHAQAAGGSDDAQAQAAPRQDDPAAAYDVYQQPGLGTTHAAGSGRGVHDAGTTATGPTPLQGPRSQD